MENKEFLKSLLFNLSKEIPHQWRVQSFSKQKAVATVMAYIDARDCMSMLNKHAIYGWTRKHYEVAGKVYCEVGIYMPDGTIQGRSDCGVESNQDAEKGQSSDSFKRACVNWGIGGFLYDTPVQYMSTNEAKTGSNFPFCIDENNKRIWNITEFVNKKNCKVDDRARQDSAYESEIKIALSEINACVKLDDLSSVWTKWKKFQTDKNFSSAKEIKKNALKSVETA